MKKVLIFCLILLCTLSVFAADVAATVKLYLSYGSDGFGFSSNKGTWEPVISMSVNGDKVGASFSWCPIDFQNSDYGFNIWIQPKDSFMLTAGANLSANIVKDFAINKTMTYGIVGYNKRGYIVNENTNRIRANYLDDSGVNVQFGFGYQPESFRDFSNADVFIAGYFNYLNTSIGTFHFDGLIKLNVENNKPSLDYSFSEVSFNRFVDSKNNIVENEDTDWIVAITEQFNFDEAYYFDHESRSKEHDSYSWCTEKFNTGFIAGLRYKYFTEAEKTVYTGLYAYGLGSYLLKDSSVSFEAETEIGHYNAELEIESRGTVSETTEKYYSQYNFDWTDGKLDASITDISLYLERHLVEKGTINLQFNYKNLSENSANDNGLFLSPGFKTEFNILELEVGATVGFDSLKNFRWNTQSAFVVSF